MIMGYEAPVEITPTSVYDKDMMKMYLAAMQRDYEQGLQDEKDYLKSVLDFISPIAADSESWANMTTKPMALLLQDPNIIRSQEGRAMIALFIASRPYAEMAKLRQSANTADQYRKLLAQGIANGTLDAETAKKLDGDLSKWNTLTNGSWNTLAPASLKSVEQVMSPYLQDLVKYGYEEDKDQSTNGWTVKTVSDDKIKDQLSKHKSDILKDPMMQLRIKESGLTPDQYINTNLYGYLRDLLTPQKTLNDKYYKDAQLTLEKEKFNLEKAKAQNEEYGGYGGSGSSIYGGSGRGQAAGYSRSKAMDLYFTGIGNQLGKSWKDAANMIGTAGDARSIVAAQSKSVAGIKNTKQLKDTIINSTKFTYRNTPVLAQLAGFSSGDNQTGYLINAKQHPNVKTAGQLASNYRTNIHDTNGKGLWNYVDNTGKNKLTNNDLRFRFTGHVNSFYGKDGQYHMYAEMVGCDEGKTLTNEHNSVKSNIGTIIYIDLGINSVKHAGLIGYKGSYLGLDNTTVDYDDRDRNAGHVMGYDDIPYRNMDWNVIL